MSRSALSKDSSEPRSDSETRADDADMVEDILEFTNIPSGTGWLVQTGEKAKWRSSSLAAPAFA
jgi:hypothetical protein